MVKIKSKENGVIKARLPVATYTDIDFYERKEQLGHDSIKTGFYLIFK